MNTNQFVGAWNLLSYQFRATDGKAIEPFGPHAVGLLTYDNVGNVAAQIMKAQRKAFASDDIAKTTPDEALTAFQSCIAYFGRYETDEKSGKVTHHVIRSVFPNWTGGDQVRFFSFSESRLTLSTPPMLVDGVLVTGVLEWERMV
jgi:hypothetical protein